MKHIDIKDELAYHNQRKQVYETARKIALKKLGFKAGDVKTPDERTLYLKMLWEVIDFFMDVYPKQKH